jgi:hypothetical protein
VAGIWAGQRVAGIWAGQRVAGIWAGQRVAGIRARQRVAGIRAGQFVAGAGRGSRGRIPAGQPGGRIVAPERTTICCSAATCCSNAARPWMVSRAEVRGRLPMKPLRISA